MLKGILPALALASTSLAQVVHVLEPDQSSPFRQFGRRIEACGERIAVQSIHDTELLDLATGARIHSFGSIANFALSEEYFVLGHGSNVASVYMTDGSFMKSIPYAGGGANVTLELAVEFVLLGSPDANEVKCHHIPTGFEWTFQVPEGATEFGRHLAVDGTEVWVTSRDAGTGDLRLHLCDLWGSPIREVTPPSAIPGDEDVQVAAWRGAFAVGHGGTGGRVQILAVDGSFVGEIPIDGVLGQLCIDEHRLLVTGEGKARLYHMGTQSVISRLRKIDLPPRAGGYGGYGKYGGALSGDRIVIAAPKADGNATEEGVIVIAHTGDDLTDVYCTSNPSSTGIPGELRVWGSTNRDVDALTLSAAKLPAGVPLLFLNSPVQAELPGAGGSNGVLCLGGQLGRSKAHLTGADGAVVIHLSVDAIPRPGWTQAVIPGETWSFQAWYRDGGSSNFTDASAVTFE